MLNEFTLLNLSQKYFFDTIHFNAYIHYLLSTTYYLNSERNLLAIPAFSLVFIVGAAIGSFLNVVIYRLPAGLSILWPPSRCPKCLHSLGMGENIPVFGWLWLRGRCLKCKTPISTRYPLVELITGLLFIAVFRQFDFTFQAVGYSILICWLLSLSLIDLDTMTLPNVLTQSGLLLGLGFVATLGWLETKEIAGIAHYLMGGIGSSVLGIWLFDLIGLVGSILFRQAAMGGGDAKLAAMIGAWLGWKFMLLSSFIACALGAFVGGGAIAVGLLSRKQPIPFGPFLALGAILTVFAGNFLITSYIELFFP